MVESGQKGWPAWKVVGREGVVGALDCRVDKSRAWLWEEALGAQGRERPLELRRQVTWVPMDAECPSGWSGCEGVAAGSRGPRGWHVNPGSVFTHCQANS